MNKEELEKRIEAFKNELLKEWTPATDMEVKEALVNEFYKRFGKHDSYMVKSIYDGKWYEFKNPTFVFDEKINLLKILDSLGRMTLFYNGKWAEVKANGK
jgi:hypothetical protein